MKSNQTTGREVYKGSVPALADTSDRFLDLDTKQSVINLCNMWSSHIHHIMNEPSIGMYRIVEHVRNKVPYMVEQKVGKLVSEMKIIFCDDLLMGNNI